MFGLVWLTINFRCFNVCDSRYFSAQPLILFLDFTYSCNIMKPPQLFLFVHRCWCFVLIMVRVFAWLGPNTCVLTAYRRKRFFVLLKFALDFHMTFIVMSCDCVSRCGFTLGQGAIPPKLELCPIPQIFGYSSSMQPVNSYTGGVLEGWSGWFGSVGLCFEGDD